MGVVIRLEDEPRASRLDYLHHAVSDAIVPFGVRVEESCDLRAEIRSGDLGAVGVTRLTAPPLEAFRTPRQIRRSDPELFKIDVPVRGRTVFAQDDRQAVLEPGDFTFVDLSRPCHVADLGDVHEVVAVKFPRQVLPFRHSDLTRLTAMPVRDRDGLGAPICTLSRYLIEHTEHDRALGGTRLANALLDLLVVAIAELLDRPAQLPAQTQRRALLARVQVFIDRHLPDSALSPGMIAAAHHISVRYLHKLFEDQDDSVARSILLRRLERCRRDLVDPELAARPVNAIAHRWGLGDPAHFSRVFRATYGDPPGEYRRRHLRLESA